MSYPPFNWSAQACVKCGCTQTHHVHWVGFHTLTGSPTGAGYLERTCVRCGYTWAERCLDDAD